MPQLLKKQASVSDNMIVWSAAAIGLVAAIILDKGSAPHKWHAAIMWTGVAFYGVLIFGRRKWRLWPFWLYWAACLGVHGFGMWLIFGKLLPRLILGTLYVVPFAFVEAIFLIGVFSKLECKLRSRDSLRQLGESVPDDADDRSFGQ